MVARRSAGSSPALRAAAALVAILSLVLGLGLAPSREVAAHQDPTPSPNGFSPWHYSESWAITGSWYNEGLHVDYYGGVHYNDPYAIDFAVPGDGCNKRLYALYDGMTVTAVDAGAGLLEMRKTIGGQQYRVRYRHMNSIIPGVGATVHSTTLVGYSGNRGVSSGCHLHLSVHRFDAGSGWWRSIPPQFCGRTYPHDHSTRFRGC
jgi:murein DD-endopeptidase MepM/ murein hydrolase activator NlpD